MTSSAVPESAAPPAHRKSGRGKKTAVASVVVGSIIAAAGLYFVIAKIVDGWGQYGSIISAARWGWLIVAVLLAFAGMTALGLVWRSVLAALGARTRYRDVFVWYQIGNLGKYVPGGIFQVMGRGELATRGGVPRSIAYNSVALSMGATYLCGALVAAVLLPVVVLLDRGSIASSWWVFLVLPLGLIALHPKVLAKLLTMAEKVFGGSPDRQIPSWGRSVRLVALHAPGWLINGLAVYATTLTFAPDAPVATILFAGIVSWVAGFLVIVVPSGLGVREAMFVALTQAALGGPTAATVAIVSRLVFVAGDLLGAAIAAGMKAHMHTRAKAAVS